jgi:hypothetical protein
VSDAIETTVAGATRVLFGTIAFICLSVGIEGVTGAEKISVGLSVFLIAAGAICAYAAIFWGTAKKVLSQEAQDAIANFARSATTKAALLCAVLISIILSPFVEQRRWPFSYPADPQVEADNKALHEQIRQDASKLDQTIASKNTELSVLTDAANRWNVAKRLRSAREPKPPCTYQMLYTQKSGGAAQFFQELLLTGGWVESSNNAVSQDLVPKGITLRTGDETTVGYLCAQSFQRAVSDIYTNPPSKIIAEQQNDFLRGCGPQCLQFEIT